jgi:hypothetical protein
MNTSHRFAALLVSASVLPVFGAATVKFTNPDQFVDVPFSHHERTDALERLEAHFSKLAAQLPSGQDLRVDVTDIDLAGNEYPGRAGRELRVLKGAADWPRIDFKFSVESQGKVVTSGTASVKDMNYLNRHNKYPRDEPLRYEKRMLDEWFKNTLGKS